MGVIVRYLFVRSRGQEGQEKLSGPLELEFRIQGSQDTGLGLALAPALLSILLWGRGGGLP